MAERQGNLGYLAIGTETTKGTPVIPAFYTLVYEESLSTNKNHQKQEPAAGTPFNTRNVLNGQYDHTGDFTVVSEPNTNAHLYDMMMSRVSDSGTTPHTWVFGFVAGTDTKSKTIDISYGNVVKRYYGVEASNIEPTYENNEERKKVSVSALGSFDTRTIATISTTTITLTTKYSDTPTKGLVATDLVRIYKESDGSVLNTTISNVNADGITLTLGASAASFAPGDTISLRPATISFDLLDTQLWSNTKWYFSDTVANAMSASQTRVERGSNYSISYDFEDDGGAKRSGSVDPAALPRTTADATISVKRHFDTPEQLQDYNDATKSAVVVRKYSGTTNQYEERAAFYSVTTENPVGNLKSKEIIYANYDMIPQTNTADSLDVRVTIINGKTTL